MALNNQTNKRDQEEKITITEMDKKRSVTHVNGEINSTMCLCCRCQREMHKVCL